MRSTNHDSVYRPAWRWLGRSLKNYKALHRETARAKGVLEQLVAAPTLTAARRILNGGKKK